MSERNVPAINAGLLYVNGLDVSYNSPLKISVAAGQCRDSSNTIDIKIDSPVVVNLDVNGINGLDVGTRNGSTWYYLYAVGSSTNMDVPGIMASASYDAPYLSLSYDSYRLIGAVRTNSGGSILKFVSIGSNNYRKVFWSIEAAAALVLNAGTSTTYASASLAALVPSMSRIAMLKAVYSPQAAGDKFFVRPTGSAIVELQSYAGNVATQPSAIQLVVNTDSYQSIDYHVTGTGSLSLWVLEFDYFI